MFEDAFKDAMEGVIRNLVLRRGDGTAAAGGRIVEAEHFVLRDRNGQARAMLTSLSEGPGLALLAPDQAILAILAADDANEAVYLQLNCPDLERKIVVRADNSGPQLFLHNEHQEVQARLLGELDAVSLELNAPDLHTKVVLRVDPDGPQLFFRDGNSQTRALIHLTGHGPALAFCDEDGRCRAQLVLNGGAPELVMLDETGQEQARYPAAPPAGSETDLS